MAILKRIREQFSNLTVRSRFFQWGGFTGLWFSKTSVYGSEVNFELTRSLYRNDKPDVFLGSAFCKPIIDLSVQFVGIPSADVNDEQLNDSINKAIRDHWAPQIQEMMRNAMRDSHTIVRFRKKSPADPLANDDDKVYGYLEIVDPETVALVYDPKTGVLSEAIVKHTVEFSDNPNDGQAPSLKEHEIWEYITPERFRYYDQLENEWIEGWEEKNQWGFVPLLEVFNEYESSLNGGQSDLETSIPFIKAFHDAFHQSLMSHKYHSTPKAKFKINDIQTFLKNNFPDSFSSDGKFTGTVDWKGREIIFLQSEEDVEFVEAKSVLGDSKTLLDFLFDCICVASETPEWAFMRIEQATQGSINAQSEPFEKKVDRKRIMFQDPIQTIIKMFLKADGKTPLTASINWSMVRDQSVLNWSQATQQITMALEVAAQRKIISDTTYRETLRPLLTKMKSPTKEAEDAESNFALEGGEGNVNIPISQNGGGQNE